MDHFLTDDTKAIILLCSVLGKDKSVAPLKLAEYNTLVQWLRNKNMRPAALLSLMDLGEVAAGIGIKQERLVALLDRGVQLGFAIEEWQRSGLWIISRSDQDYPTRYKSHLKEKAPPLLFGAGDRNLLQGGGVAIVGSRNINIEGEGFTRHVAEECAFCKMPVVSGGARGVDQIAMRSALASGGKVVGILAENLLRASIERHARHAIAEGQLLLISPYHPQARFTVGAAMGRNKLIYAMADYGLIINAEHKKGGTWAGAEEELKRRNSIPVFVRMSESASLGNKKLLELGAQEWPREIIQGTLPEILADAVANRSMPENVTPKNLNLFDCQPQESLQERQVVKEKIEEVEISLPLEPEVNSVESEPLQSIYETVLPIILAHLGSPATGDELAKTLDVAKGQLNAWLKRAAEEGKVKKLKNPVRYSAVGGNK